MSSRPFSPQQFGKYHLTERIASGGMAEVYRATLRNEAGFEKEVALKRILPFFGTDEGFIALFRDEARIASTLSHANIAQVFDFGEVDGSFYLTMELVDGVDLTTLSDRLRKEGQPMPLATAAFIISEAARGLGYAHDKKGSDGRPLGIVHRDVSPHNVLCSYAGEVKLTDFGIAKAAGKVHKTATGVVMGKLRYMSPEQVAGEPLDPRSDVFSLGVVFYELLTGGPIFPGDQTLRLAELIHTAPIDPPSSRNPAIPRELDAIVMRCLGRPASERYARCGELARELSLFLNQHAPGFTREDLGALVARVAVPGAAANAATLAGATERQKGLALEATATPGPPRTLTAPPDDHSRPPTVRLGAEDGAGPVARSHKVNPPPTVELGAPASRRRKRRLSVEAWVGLALVGVIIASGIVVLMRFTLSRDERPASLTSVGRDAAVAGRDGGLIVTAPVDAGPIAIAPFTLKPTATDEERRELQAEVDTQLVARRGIQSPEYHVFLTGLDSALAALTLAEDGTAGDAPALPPAVAAAVAQRRLERTVDVVIDYVRATGELPPNVRGAAKSFLQRHPSALAYPVATGAQRLPPYSAAALAVWLFPGEPRRLVELAYANETLRRWCDPPAPPRRHFAPHLCERAALIEELRASTPHDMTAEALTRWDAAVPPGEHAAAGGGTTVALRNVAYVSGSRSYLYELSVDVDLGAPSEIRPYLAAVSFRDSSTAQSKIDPRDVEPLANGSGARITFEVPRRLVAPILKWGDATLRLPAPPWNGPE